MGRYKLQDSVLIGNLHKIRVSLGTSKEGEAAEPSKLDIEAMGLRFTETTSNISSIKKVEKLFNLLSEVGSSHSLDLQLGKCRHELSNLEANLWAVEQEMLSLEKQLVSFLSTRRLVCSRFNQEK